MLVGRVVVVLILIFFRGFLTIFYLHRIVSDVLEYYLWDYWLIANCNWWLCTVRCASFRIIVHLLFFNLLSLQVLDWSGSHYPETNLLVTSWC